MSNKLKIALWVVGGIALIMLIVWGVRRYNSALAATNVQKKVDEQLQTIKEQFADEAAFNHFMKNFVAPFKNKPVVVSPADKVALQNASSFGSGISRTYLITQLPSGSFVKRSIGAIDFGNMSKGRALVTIQKIAEGTSVIAKDTFDKIPFGPSISFQDFLTYIP